MKRAGEEVHTPPICLARYLKFECLLFLCFVGKKEKDLLQVCTVIETIRSSMDDKRRSYYTYLQS